MWSSRIGLRPTVLPESKNRADKQWGFPRNLGDPVVSTEERGCRGRRRRRPPGPPALTFWTGGSKRQNVADGIAKRRQRSAARRTAGSRSVLIVSSKPGNGIRLGPGGEKRDVWLWIRGRATRRRHRTPKPVSTKRPRIAVYPMRDGTASRCETIT